MPSCRVSDPCSRVRSRHAPIWASCLDRLTKLQRAARERPTASGRLGHVLLAEQDAAMSYQDARHSYPRGHPVMPCIRLTPSSAARAAPAGRDHLRAFMKRRILVAGPVVRWLERLGAHDP